MTDREIIEGLPLMTRKQAVAFLNLRGIPVTLNGLNEACCRQRGPKPSSKWGRVFLYEPRELLDWAEKRLRPCLPNAYRSMNKSENGEHSKA